MKKITVIALISFIIDRVTKYFVVTKMEVGESIEIVENLLYITSHRNQGAAWGIFQGKMIFFYAVTGFSLYLFYTIYKEISKDTFFTYLGIGLVLGGTFGNFFDRLFFKEVVDFIDCIIPVINYDYPIWNVADASLLVGVAIVMVIMVMDTIKENKNGKI